VARRLVNAEADSRRPSDGPVVTCALIGRDRLFLDLLSGMLQLRRGLRIVAQSVGIESCDGLRPDLVVIDIDRLGQPGIRLARTIMDRQSTVRCVLIVESHGSVSIPQWCTKGSHVVIGKDATFEAMLEGIESLFSDRLATPVAGIDGHRHKALTDREAEVLALIGEGLTTKEIAILLGRSPYTVQTHRKRIAGKLGRLGSALARRAKGLRHTSGTDGHARD
jgi:DNA-binding NarL/FixJ family response regulator